MPVPLEIVTRQATLGAAARARVARLATKLATFDDRLHGCRVTVDVPQRFPAGRPVAYRVGIQLSVPGENLTIRRQQAPHLDSAIQAAFLAAGRRLQDAARRRRGDVKRHARPPRLVARRG